MQEIKWLIFSYTNRCKSHFWFISTTPQSALQHRLICKMKKASFRCINTQKKKTYYFQKKEKNRPKQAAVERQQNKGEKWECSKQLSKLHYTTNYKFTMDTLHIKFDLAHQIWFKLYMLGNIIQLHFLQFTATKQSIESEE